MCVGELLKSGPLHWMSVSVTFIVQLLLCEVSEGGEMVRVCQW